MKKIVVYYSRSGTTRKVAEAIAKELKCATEEIIDLADRAGALGYVRAGMHASKKKLAETKKIKHNPSLHELIVIGTPIWAWKMTPAIRTYIKQAGKDLKKVAFFCTQGGSGGKGTFSEMEKLVGKRPIATLELAANEIMSGDHAKKIKEFAKLLI